MLTHLLLMRHAKSSWKDATQTDHERPLNGRGRQACINMAGALMARRYAPDTIWTSDAERTVETAKRLIRIIPGAQQVIRTPKFYHASARTVIETCAAQTQPSGKLMLLGHNPGWSELYEYFSGASHAFPTGCCAVFERTDAEGSWLEPKSWRTIDVILPRDLET